MLLALCLVSFSNLLREKILFHMTSHRLGMNYCEDVSVWKMGFSSLRHLILITNLLRGLKFNLPSFSPVNVVLLHLIYSTNSGVCIVSLLLSALCSG